MEFVWVIGVAAAVTAVASFVVLRIALRVGAVHVPRARDMHQTPVPRLGGVAMFVGLAVSFFAAAFIERFQLLWSAPLQMWALFGACVLIAVVGFLDDLLDLDWMVKLGAQLAAASIVASSGTQILSVPFGDTLVVASPTMNFLITVFLIVLVMNALNFIDGLDGLVAGVAIIANSVFLLYTMLLEDDTGERRAITLAALLAAIIIGICVGFFPYNWHRARMFMGDTGALLIGLLMATATVSVTGQLNPAVLDQKLVIASYIPIILPVAVLVMPLADFSLAVVRRVLAGKSPFSADRKHLHHRLIDYGHSPRQAVSIFYVWTLVLSLVCLLVFVLQSWVVPAVVLGVGSVVCALITLVPLSRLRDRLAQRGLMRTRAPRSHDAPDATRIPDARVPGPTPGPRGSATTDSRPVHRS